MVGKSYLSLQTFLTELSENCLLLARHGETDWNAMGIIQGQQDRPLNLRGFEQRKNLFFLLNPIRLHRIYCSTLQRTIETAIPLSTEKNVPLEKMPELNEAKLGVFEGQHKEVFSDKFSRKQYQSFLDDEINIVLPGGGESLKMVDKRICNLVSSIVNNAVDLGHVLVVGHRNVNKMIIRNLLGLTFEQGYQVEHKNGWLYIFAPKRAEIFLIDMPAPTNPVRVRSGYETIDMVSAQ